MLVIIYAWLEEVLWSLVKQYNVAPLPSTLENDNIIIIYWQNVIVLKYHSENLNLGNKKHHGQRHNDNDKLFSQH